MDTNGPISHCIWNWPTIVPFIDMVEIFNHLKNSIQPQNLSIWSDWREKDKWNCLFTPLPMTLSRYLNLILFEDEYDDNGMGNCTVKMVTIPEASLSSLEGHGRLHFRAGSAVYSNRLRQYPCGPTSLFYYILFEWFKHCSFFYGGKTSMIIRSFMNWSSWVATGRICRQQSILSLVSFISMWIHIHSISKQSNMSWKKWVSE